MPAPKSYVERRAGPAHLLCLAGLSVGPAAQVRLVEEVGEEQQVTEVHEGGPANVVDTGRAVSLRQPAVNQHRHHQPHGHLDNLGAGHEYGAGPRHTPARGTRSVIAIHERVHAEIHGHEPAAAGHHVLVGEPGVEQHRDVVVPVEEEQLLLPEHDEGGVTCADSVVRSSKR